VCAQRRTLLGWHPLPCPRSILISPGRAIRNQAGILLGGVEGNWAPPADPRRVLRPSMPGPGDLVAGWAGGGVICTARLAGADMAAKGVFRGAAQPASPPPRYHRPDRRAATACRPLPGDHGLARGRHDHGPAAPQIANLQGVQFHRKSVLTRTAIALLANFLRQAAGAVTGNAALRSLDPALCLGRATQGRRQGRTLPWPLPPSFRPAGHLPQRPAAGLRLVSPAASQARWRGRSPAMATPPLLIQGGGPGCCSIPFKAVVAPPGCAESAG